MFVHQGYVIDTEAHELITVYPSSTRCDLCQERLSDDPDADEAEAVALIGVLDGAKRDYWICAACALDVL